jgi:hypothetical protein
MGIIVALRHATSRSRAANSASFSAVTPADCAGAVARIADHHSGGTRPRCHHLETVEAPTPSSVASFSRLGHSSMIERNDVISDMRAIMGPSVPKCKPVLSRDLHGALGHNVLMHEDEWRQLFRQRITEARKPRTQQDMAELLKIDRDTYKQYEAKRASIMPPWLFRQFCKITGKSLEWFLGEIVEVKAKPRKKRRTRRKIA